MSWLCAWCATNGKHPISEAWRPDDEEPVTTVFGEKITANFSDDANIILGARQSPEMGDSVTVTAILTGITSKYVLGKVPKEEAVQIDTLDLEALNF